MARAGPAQPRALFELALGDAKAAETTLRDAYEVLETLGEKAFLSTTAAMLAEVLYQQERFDEAARFQRIGEESASSDDFLTHIWTKGVRAKLLAREGHSDEACRVARQGVIIAEATDSPDLQARSLVAEAYVLRLVGRE